MKIGIFDSGLGGKLILDAVSHQLPQYDYAYYGDTANVPYGDKTEEEIFELTTKGIEYLFAEGCVLAVVACNTASGASLRKIQSQWLPDTYPANKVLGVVVPTVEVLLQRGVEKSLLLATKRTVTAQRYTHELNKILPKAVAIVGQAAPELVPRIEAGDIDGAVGIASDYISAAIANDPELDSVILGCTHYSLLVGELRKRFPEVSFFAQTEIIPDKLRAYLQSHPEVNEKLTTGGSVTEHVTGQPE